MKLRLLTLVCVTAICAIAATSAQADPSGGPPICNGVESPISGSYSSLTITGNQYVPDGSSLSVARNLTVAPGACLDAYTTGTVTVGGSLFVQRAAILGLGCAPFEDGDFAPCGYTVTNDTVGGNLTASQPLTMYLSADTIKGNLTSTGGGPGVTYDPYVNFPIKDSVIGGNVVVSGWQGAWFGLLRSTVGGDAVFTNILGADPDSNEVATNSISGNLICQRNDPAPQIGDSGGSPNVVGGHELGQCSGL